MTRSGPALQICLPKRKAFLAGRVAIFKHTIEELGGELASDLGAVDDWVSQYEGTVKLSPGPIPLSGASPEMRPYYEIPG